MSARDTFLQYYQTADGTKPAHPGLIKAACLYVMELKRAGLSLEDATRRLQLLIRTAGGRTPETSRLDSDIMVHCIDQYDQPLPSPPPKPPDFVG